MKIVEIKCPSCGGNLQIRDGRKDCFCEYCGSHLFLDDENRTITHVYVVRDEAKIKELELEEKQKEKFKKRAMIWLISLIIFAVSGITIVHFFGKLQGFLAIVYLVFMIYIIFYGLFVFISFPSKSTSDKK